ncbi:MAG: TerC family protein, partial [Chloroflexota bacterium]|nr:TerC family protein [Chloroflexota bacterium]
MPGVSPELVTRVLQIILIDLVLSGDNAVVIGMAAAPLPPRQRRWAILAGGGAAIVLRITLTSLAALLLGLPFLRA